MIKMQNIAIRGRYLWIKKTEPAAARMVFGERIASHDDRYGRLFSF